MLFCTFLSYSLSLTLGSSEVPGHESSEIIVPKSLLDQAGSLSSSSTHVKSFSAASPDSSQHTLADISSLNSYSPATIPLASPGGHSDISDTSTLKGSVTNVVHFSTSDGSDNSTVKEYVEQREEKSGSDDFSGLEPIAHEKKLSQQFTEILGTELSSEEKASTFCVGKGKENEDFFTSSLPIMQGGVSSAFVSAGDNNKSELASGQIGFISPGDASGGLFISNTGDEEKDLEVARTLLSLSEMPKSGLVYDADEHSLLPTDQHFKKENVISQRANIKVSEVPDEEGVINDAPKSAEVETLKFTGSGVNSSSGNQEEESVARRDTSDVTSVQSSEDLLFFDEVADLNSATAEVVAVVNEHSLLDDDPPRIKEVCAFGAFSLKQSSLPLPVSEIVAEKTDSGRVYNSFLIALPPPNFLRWKRNLLKFVVFKHCWA